MASQNDTINKLVADFASFQGGYQAFVTDFGTFATAVQAFIASASSGTGGTTLSPEDAAALADIDTKLQDLSTAATAADAVLKGITVPVPPPVV